MKKTKIINLLFILCCISGCETNLSEIPDNRILIDTPEKISEILTNAYPQRTYHAFAETLSDNVEESSYLTHKLSQNYKQNYFWEEENDLEDDDSQSNYWTACYIAIAHANEALANIDKIAKGDNLNTQKGEALLARAYAHFMLVSFWSEPYNPSTAKTALGIPYITMPEDQLVVKYKRNTVEEVFDKIEKDIVEGLPLIKDNYAHPKFHFTKAAAKAFAARFYLIKGNWDKVIELTNDLGNSPGGILRDYYSILKLKGLSSQQERYASSQEPTNLLISYVRSSYGDTYLSNNYYLTYSLMQETIMKPFFKGKFLNYSRWTNYAVAFTAKFFPYTKYTNLTKRNKESYFPIVMFTNDELFLNRIEALVMKNRFIEARDALEFFMSIRTLEYDPKTDKLTEKLLIKNYPFIKDEYTPFYNLTPLQTSYIKAITDAKRKETLQEGLRWLDIKRFNLAIDHSYLTRTINTIHLAKNDKRKVLQIPPNEIAKGLEANPR